MTLAGSSFAAVLIALVAAPSPAPSTTAAPPATTQAQPLVATPAPAPTLDPLAYDDPGMHFRAPDGWTRIALSEAPAASGDKRPPAAFYVYHPGKSDQRSIVIDIQPFDGTLEGFVNSRESELRSGGEGTFVDRKVKTPLANGMPAYFLASSRLGGSVGSGLKRYDDLIYDLTRSIDVALIGRYGDVDDREAKAIFESLVVVVYPRRR